MKKIRLAAIGCGNRTQIYMKMASGMPERYEIVAAADLRPGRVENVRQLSGNPSFRSFDSDKAILAEPKLADIMIIGTQDEYHYEPCREALKKGYDILLEKPIATTAAKILELEQLADKLNRKVMICYVLRYTSFYMKVKEIVDSGILGDIVTINASEGLDPWHQAHSFVRGHWAVVEKSSPMIAAKCCHDIDMLLWLVGKRSVKVSSFGSCYYFNQEHAPEGAPLRCTDGCPVEKDCIYNAKLYASTRRDPWLGVIYDNAEKADQQEIFDWLGECPWGRCVFRSDNTAVDHQVL
ncbi:MAG: Gfo/Idh/MocA family protein, partial [Planctomycetota bacterium]